MEAKDTVMTYERIQEIDLKNAESNFTDALWDVAREQAEISFPLGIKEVVEWIKEHQIGNEFSTISIPIFTYLTKLKEWGIK